MYIIDFLKNLCQETLLSAYPEQKDLFSIDNIEITPATQNKFGHYQCNSAMKLCKSLKVPPRDIAVKIQKLLAEKNRNVFEKIEIAGPGFINMTLAKNFLIKLLIEQIQSETLGVEKTTKPLKVVLDYSAPNIAKEMHVGHLRSTIIGDCMARLCEFLGHETLKLNHIGDWGTQFGMLIAYLKENYSDLIEKKQISLSLTDLMSCYKLSKEKFDRSSTFKTTSQQEVVKLQGGDETSIYIWKKICEISSTAYQEIYDLLGVNLIERGESFYNPMLKDVIDKVSAVKIKDGDKEKNLVTISEGAKCVYLDGFVNREGEPLPLIIQKSDGGYNYASTDLAALYHRVTKEKADWLLYTTDASQAQHFAMVFKTAELAGFYDPQKVRINHVPFGLVLRDDGKKFKTRSGETEKLIDLINTAISKTKDLLIKRNPNLNKDELEKTSKILGINAIKYADLANNRSSNYKFCYNRMIQFEGNTAAFLTYAYVRIQSIKAKINKNIDEIILQACKNSPDFKNLQANNLQDSKCPLVLETEEELDLVLHLVRFADLINSFTKELLPHRLAEYLFKLAEKFHLFFHRCKVQGHCNEDSRLILCEATSKVMLKGFNILGLTPPEKM